MNIIEFLNELAFRKDKKEYTADLIHKLIKDKQPETAQILLLSYLIQK